MKTKYLFFSFILLNLFFTNARLSAQVNSSLIKDKTINKKLIEINSFVLFVESAEVSKRFYTGIFDLKVREDLPGYIQLEGGITLWDRKIAQDVIFKSKNTKNDSPAVKKFEFYFETEDIETVFQKLEKSGVIFIHKLETQPWAQRVIRFYDPDRNIIEVGEKMEVVVKQLKKQNFSDEEIAKRTMLPIEAIKGILKQ